MGSKTVDETLFSPRPRGHTAAHRKSPVIPNGGRAEALKLTVEVLEVVAFI